MQHATHLVVSFRADSIMIWLISTLRLIMLSVPLTSRLFPQEFCVAVCTSWRCRQQSQQSANCTTVPPPRQVSAAAPAETKERGAEIGKEASCSSLAVLAALCPEISKSHVRLRTCARKAWKKNFLNKGAAWNWCLPSSFSRCPKTLDNVCVTLLLALLLDGRVPSRIKQMNNLGYSKLENKAWFE